MGTVTLLSTKEFLNFDMEWFDMFNHMAFFVGAVCTVLFTIVATLIYKRYSLNNRNKTKNSKMDLFINPQYNTI